MKELRTKTVRAVGWAAVVQVISQVISFLFGIALARLLVPDDFGLIAMALVFTGLASLLAEIGLGSALVQKKDIREEHFSSVFWINILLGCALGSMLFFVSPWLSIFYERPEVEGICKLLSISFPIGALAIVPRNILVKRLLFKSIAFIDLFALIASGVIAIALAVKGYGYWCLVIQRLSQIVFLTMFTWVVSDWRPKKWVSSESLRELLGFSSSVLGTQLMQYATRHLDKLLLGKVLGGTVLGIYDKAYSMMMFPLLNVSQVIGKVMFPSLSLIQSDKDRVRGIYLRTIRTISLLTFPMMAGLFVVADSFVLGVLGAHWVELIPVLRIFCIAGLAASIVTVTGALYLSQGAAGLQFRVNMITQPIRVVGVVAGLPWGGIGVAIGFTASLLVVSLITLTVAGRLVQLRITTIFRSLYPTLVSSLVMAVPVWYIRPFLKWENELLVFLVQAAAGVIIYWGSVSATKIRAYQDVTGVLQDEFVSWRQETKSR